MVTTKLDDLDPDQRGAAVALRNAFLEGLRDAAAVPEVISSDADVAAHKLLGCDMFMAMLVLASSVDALPPQASEVTRHYLERLLGRELEALAIQVIENRGPIGSNYCEGQHA